MHKIFLTEPEVSVIHGAEDIVAVLGGFPSMENGTLAKLSIQPLREPFHIVSLLFDITNWAQVSSRYTEIPRPPHRFIRMTIFNVRNIFCTANMHFTVCGEIKFSNATDRMEVGQDDMPSNTKIIHPPFYLFCIRSGREFALEIPSGKPLVAAEFCDQAPPGPTAEFLAETFFKNELDQLKSQRRV